MNIMKEMKMENPIAEDDPDNENPFRLPVKTEDELPVSTFQRIPVARFLLRFEDLTPYNINLSF